jgi:hypothetical protein
MVIPFARLTNLNVAMEEPAFLRRMREGTEQEVRKIDEKRRRRGSQEIIDEDEAPQVVIQDKDRDQIDAAEAKAYVAEKAGVKVDKSKHDTVKAALPSKPKEENVSLGMKKTKKAKDGVKRAVEENEAADVTDKARMSGPKKGKRLKLSFEEDE